jgi:hypothetical protein
LRVNGAFHVDPHLCWNSWLKKGDRVELKLTLWSSWCPSMSQAPSLVSQLNPTTRKYSTRSRPVTITDHHCDGRVVLDADVSESEPQLRYAGRQLL